MYLGLSYRVGIRRLIVQHSYVARRGFSTRIPRGGVIDTVSNLVTLRTTNLHHAVAMPMGELQRMLAIGDVLSGPNCPLLAPLPLTNVIDLISTLLPGIQPGRSHSAFSSARRGLWSGHLYTHVACLDRIDLIVGRTGLSEDVVRVMMAYPATFPLLWAGCMPFGGVTIDVCPNPQIGSEVIPTSRFVLTRGRDPILFSDHTSVPRNPRLGVNASATYFLAQTLYGHALTGSVLHYMCVTNNGEIIVMWTGAGVGVPIVGGHLNNIVALHDGHGIWPAMVRNMREALRDREIVRRIAAVVQGSEGEPADLRREVSAMNMIMEARNGHRAPLYPLGQFNNQYLGALGRAGSLLWGGSGMNPKGTWNE